MITRWETVVSKTATVLNRPYAEVEAIILQHARWIREHASNPIKMETDLFGIGYYSARYGRLLSRIEVLKRRIEFKKVRLEYYNSISNEEKAADITSQIANYEAMISRFNEFIAIKAEVREAMMTMKYPTRDAYIKYKLEKEGLTEKDIQPLVKCVKLVPIIKVRKKYIKKKTRFSPRGPYKGKRKAKRRPGWRPPQENEDTD